MKKNLYVCASILALSGATSPAFSQQTSHDMAEASANAPTNSSGQDSVIAGDIVVTAQRRAERIRDVPISIVARTGADLQKAGLTNVRDLQMTVPGLVFTTQVGAFSSPTIRGVSSSLNSAGADSPTALYVDGIYQINKLANLFDLADIQRVEVLKGPQGTLFGRNAVAGAIAIHTLDPSFTLSGNISLSNGLYVGNNVKTAPSFLVKGYVSGPIIDNLLAVSLAGNFEYTPGYLTNQITGKRTGRIEKYLYRAKILITPTDWLRLKIGGIYAHSDDAASSAIAPYKGNSNAAFYPDSIVPTQPWHVASPFPGGTESATVTYKSVSLHGEARLSDLGTLTTVTAYTNIKGFTTQEASAAYAPTCEALMRCAPFYLQYPSKSFQQEVNFVSEKFGPISIVAGAFYFRDTSGIEGNTFPFFLAGGEVNTTIRGRGFFNLSTSKAKAWAAFGEANVDISDSLHVIAGMRYSWERRYGINRTGPTPFIFPTTTGPIENSSWTPRLSVRYDISPSANIYATYSKGFKSGLVDVSSLTNDIVKPETLNSYEVGTKIGTRTFNLNAAAFYYDYTNLQHSNFNGSRTSLTNAGNAEILGAEGDGSIRFSDQFQINGSVSWLIKARYKDFTTGLDFLLPNSPVGMSRVQVNANGLRMIKSPKITASLGADYSFETNSGKVELNASAGYSSSMKWNLLGRIKNPAHVLINTSASYSPTEGPWRISVFTKNLTNRSVIGGTAFGAAADAVVYIPPRQIGVRADYRF